MRLVKQSKWQDFLDGFRNVLYILDSYDTIEHFPDDFWESLSYGWCQEYIYPYDDPFQIHIPSPERKLRLGK